MRLLSRFWATGLLALSFTIAAHAQTNAGFVRGTVTDERGAVVSGAHVTLTNALTGYQQTAVTDAQGNYRLVDVPFNPYTLAVEAQGFARTTQEIVVRSNLVQQADVRLTVAPVEQTVNVLSENALLDAEKTAP